jgi:hypothetical protein
MKLSEVFPSRWLKSEDIEGETLVVIKELVFDKMRNEDGKDEEKPVLLFKGVDKGLVLNKTNAERISEQHGDETDNWTGKKITLTTESVTAFGKTQWAIRVKPERPATGKGIRPVVEPEAEKEIPF